MHHNLESPISYCELESARILGVEEIAVRDINRSSDVEFYIRFCFIVVV